MASFHLLEQIAPPSQRKILYKWKMVLVVSLAQEAKLNLDYLMNFRLTDFPSALFNINASMRKVVKSKLIEQYCFNETPTHLLTDAPVIVDMGL